MRILDFLDLSIAQILALPPEWNNDDPREWRYQVDERGEVTGREPVQQPAAAVDDHRFCGEGHR